MEKRKFLKRVLTFLLGVTLTTTSVTGNTAGASKSTKAGKAYAAAILSGKIPL